MVVALLKEHGVHRIIVSPGTTNSTLAVSVQSDDFFDVYSSVDERSAAYMACGMAGTSGEPVALSCTGATASRNYLPGLTEAYYRKLPVIAITSFNGDYGVGQLLPQDIDRRQVPNDAVLLSVDLPLIKDDTDARYCNRLINQAILETKRRGGGPVHINLPTAYNPTFSAEPGPLSRCIERYSQPEDFPSIDPKKKVIVEIGAHQVFTKSQEDALSAFAKSHEAVVFCDHTSNYHGFGRILATLPVDSLYPDSAEWNSLKPDLTICIGEISGDYAADRYLQDPDVATDSWRVSPDGEIRDRFGTLTKVFECSEERFFATLAGAESQSHRYLERWQQYAKKIRGLFPDLAFSNMWVAHELAPHIPQNSIMFFAILTSLRDWNYNELDPSIRCFSNTGGFGIDGSISTMLGSSLVESETLHFLAVGDLAFFYDMNALGNRSLGPNVRILLINNKVGQQMRLPYSLAYAFKEEALDYVCAQDHFQSHGSVSAAQAWSEAMGFTYLLANDKDSFKASMDQFVDPTINKPMVFECVVPTDDDLEVTNDMLYLDPVVRRKHEVKQAVKKVLPKSLVRKLER